MMGAGRPMRYPVKWGHRSAMLLLVLTVAASLPGCGYATGGQYPEQYQTVAVPIFENRTFYRRVENELAEALVKQIEQRTPYKVTDAARADTVLTGRIRQIEQEMVARHRRGGLPEEMEVRFVVDFQWRDQITGQTLRDRRGFESVGSYVLTRPVGQRFEQAQHQAVQRLAEDIVAVMGGVW